MFRKIFAWMQKYERHLAVASMLSGFAFDQVFFDRIDLWRTQVLLASYTVVCFVSILALHVIEERALQGRGRPRWRPVLPIATQFSLGGFWSAFVFFYGHSAALPASWPFLLLLLAILVGNEYFAKYHERLVFTSILFSFALYSYAIFEVPVIVGSLGTGVFLLSGLVAVTVFAAFTALLRLLGRNRFGQDVWRIRVGALMVLALMNVFYFTNILPPLPLSAKAGGVYHSVMRVPGAYVAQAEPADRSWLVRYLGFAPALHVALGDSVYAYASVFAPTALTTTIVHRWQWYDPAAKAWETRFALAYPIQGGADGGYRGYSAAVMRMAGRWRVSVETVDGRVIARLPFSVAFVDTEPALETVTLP